MIIQRQNHDRAPATIAHSELDAALALLQSQVKQFSQMGLVC